MSSADLLANDMRSCSPAAILQEHASRQPEAEAIISETVSLTYGEFCERVTAFAGWLLHRGLVQGEVTGICIPDEIGHLVCAMALLCLDTPHMSLGSHENAKTKRALAGKVNVTQLVVARPDDWMDGFRTIVAPAQDLRAIAAAPYVTASSMSRGRTPDSIGMYLNTSGSTNVPKTMGITLGRLLAGAKRYADNPKERRVLRTGSIEFDAHRFQRVCSLLAGNTCVFSRDLNPESLAALCGRARVSLIHLNAYKLASLAQGATDGCGRLPSFTGILTGGSRVPGRLRERVKHLLTDDLWVLYATSECGMISRASPDQHEAFPEGVGFPAADVTVEIIGPSGDVLEPGEIGKIRVRKASMTKGYVSEPGATSNFRDGWFYPGDLVSLEEGTPLIFHGRADDVMILNGINIFPGAIEDTLEGHPDVKEAVAYSIKSRVHGEIPAAAVVLSANAGRRDAVHLLEYCRQSLGIRGPRQIVFVDRIPRNVAGKPLRRELASS